MKEKKKPRVTFELYVLWNSGESCTGTGTKKACLEQHELFAGSPFIKEAYVERMEDGLSTHVLALWNLPDLPGGVSYSPAVDGGEAWTLDPTTRVLL